MGSGQCSLQLGAGGVQARGDLAGLGAMLGGRRAPLGRSASRGTWAACSFMGLVRCGTTASRPPRFEAARLCQSHPSSMVRRRLTGVTKRAVGLAWLSCRPG